MDAHAQELRFQLRHLNLAARAWGDPADPPMLALHGWLDNAASFDRLAPLLRGRRVVALDLPGHGRSEHRPPGCGYPYFDYLDVIGQVIDHLGRERVDLLGHSLGATLASSFAAVAPQRVERLLLIEGLGPLSQPPSATLEQLRRAHSARAVLERRALRVFADLDAAITARQRGTPLSDAAARVLVQRGTRTADGGSHGLVWSSDPQLTLPSAVRLHEAQVLAMLAGIRAPTCLVLAEPAAPYLVEPALSVRIAAVADIDVTRLPGSHHLHLEDPAPVAAVFNEWLARHPLA